MEDEAGGDRMVVRLMEKNWGMKKGLPFCSMQIGKRDTYISHSFYLGRETESYKLSKKTKLGMSMFLDMVVQNLPPGASQDFPQQILVQVVLWQYVCLHQENMPKSVPKKTPPIG